MGVGQRVAKHGFCPRGRPVLASTSRRKIAYRVMKSGRRWNPAGGAVFSIDCTL